MELGGLYRHKRFIFMETKNSVTIPTEIESGSLSRLVLGQPLRTDDATHQTISKKVGLAVFASDALSSVAYATGEILYVLAAAGVGILSLSVPIAGAICGLLLILTLSYRQTIFAYPGGGGAYIVARDNLGEHVAQLAGAALLTDYVLTVAVSIASGVEQIASAAPMLYNYRVIICIGLIGLMTIVNLRGVKESGLFFAGPTYFFVAMMLLLIAVGAWQWSNQTLSTVVDAEYHIQITQSLTLFLILRAFSSGSTALTGVEAISNGIMAFKEPKSRNAANTMLAMSGLLMVMFMGITLLANATKVMPSETETVISQLARTIFGQKSVLYYAAIGATTVILIMAANTSYADFPRLAALQAGDGFLPRQLTLRGQRLVFTWGVTALALCASILIVAFNAKTTALIPLYAIGVFLSFTISQAGMVVRWYRISHLKPGEELKAGHSVLHHDKHWYAKIAINALGCFVSGMVTLVFAITKFSHGAWIVVFVMTGMVTVFFRVHRHYQSVAQSLSLQNERGSTPHSRHCAIILVSSVHRGTLVAARYAKLIHAEKLVAVHIATNPEVTQRVYERWHQWMPDIPMVIVESPYRTLTRPLIRYINQLVKQESLDLVTIVIPQFVCVHWWHHLLHNQTALMIRQAFIFDRDKVVIEVPFRLEE